MSKEKSPELLPCPFCGGEATYICRKRTGSISGDNGYETIVMCADNHHECGARITKWGLRKDWSKNSAIVAWNRRAHEPN